MTTNHQLTLTVEQAAQVLGIGRSTAYELVRTGDLKCIHLRRRIVIPVAHLADRLGVSHADVRETAMEAAETHRLQPQPGHQPAVAKSSANPVSGEALRLF